MNKLLLSICIIICTSLTTIAQFNKDCSDAMELCGLQNIRISNTEGIGEIDLGIDETCVSMEYNSHWFIWRVQSAGVITFTLTPDSDEQDLDFVIFKLDIEEDCSSKTLVRCMASGETANAPPSDDCFGPTGLAEGNVDTEEVAGCQEGDNNFLAPLAVEAEEHYVMLVNDFSQTGLGYTIDYESTGMLYCLINDTDEKLVNQGALIFPTVSKGVFYLDFNNSNIDLSILQVFNVNGQLVYQQMVNEAVTLDLHHLTEGVFTVRLLCGNKQSVHRIVVAN